MTTRNKNGRFTAVKKEEKPQMTMLTFSQAASYLAIKKPALKRIIESPKNSAIFNPDAVKVTHFHDEVPDLIEIDQAALDAYTTAKASGKVGARATRSGKDRKWLQYLPDARIAEYQALMVANGFSEAKPAYKAKRAKTNAASAPANLVEDLIEA